MRCIKLLLLKFLLSFLLFAFYSCATRTLSPDIVQKEEIIETPQIIVEPVIDSEDDSVTAENIEPAYIIEPPAEDKIVLTFAGDIMAHTNVTRMNDFSLIYTDITSLLQSDDLSFANLETPVHSGRPYENYPSFNVQAPYVDAAITAGFDVFSLANNHTNDQGKAGIDKTLEYFSIKRTEGVYSAGIKEYPSSELTYEIIEKNGFTILFAAFTEIVNSLAHVEYFDYISTSNTAREILKKQLISMRNEHQCDLFILSVHCYESEYVIPVSKARKSFYYDLLDCGVDVLWANHPHVLQEWELIEDCNTGLLTKAVFYSIGNTISGQRYVYNFDNPGAAREYTGDSMLFQIEFTKIDESRPYITFSKQHLITTHIDSQKNSLIKLLTKEFIETQDKKYKDYYSKRLELLGKIKGTTLCR